MSGRFPLELVRLVRELPLWRLWVDAPTEVIHGASAGEPVVVSSGPALPLEVTTLMPAARALR